MPILSDLESFTVENVEYTGEQNCSYFFRSKDTISLNSSSLSEINLELIPISSRFSLNSEENDGNISWINGLEPGSGEVDVQLDSSDELPYYEFLFADNNESPISGITNKNFIDCINPLLFNHSTFFSFEYRNLNLTKEHSNSIHSITLELRFNNGSINFLLSDNGSSLGVPVEENIFKPSFNSLYIKLNHTNNNGWKKFTFNITKLLETYFTPSEFNMFSNIASLYFYSFAFIPAYNFTLDVREVNYTTILPGINPFDYYINNSIVESVAGTFLYETYSKNLDIQVLEATIWQENQFSQFELKLIRRIDLSTTPSIATWNHTKIMMELNVSFPQLIPSPNYTNLFVKLPNDWILQGFKNFSYTFINVGVIDLLDGSVSGFLYKSVLNFSKNLNLICYSTNFITSVSAPSVVSHYEVYKIRGELLKPNFGSINLYIKNDTIFSYQTTMAMMNGTFEFLILRIEETIPIGTHIIEINWYYQYEYGIYEQLVYVSSNISENTSINLYTGNYIEIFRFEPLVINLSLMTNGIVINNSEITVFFYIDTNIVFFNHSSPYFYTIHVKHVSWNPGSYNLTLIASYGNNFFCNQTVSLEIYSSTLEIMFDNSPQKAYRGFDLSLKSNVAILPSGVGISWVADEFDLHYWINDAKFLQSKTDAYGVSEITIPSDFFSDFSYFQLTVILQLDEVILEIESYPIQVLNSSFLEGRILPEILESSRSSAISNQSYYQIYEIRYPKTGSDWYFTVLNSSTTPISAYLIHNDQSIEVEIIDNYIIWDVISILNSTDTLLLEYNGPLVYFNILNQAPNLFIRLECYSSHLLMDYSLELDLTFIQFPFYQITLLDFLKRNISNSYQFHIIDSLLTIHNLNILGGLTAIYYLNISCEIPKIEIYENIKETHVYNDSIEGSWIFSTKTPFHFAVLYNIPNLYSSKCLNTSITILENDTFIISAIFPKFKWNTTIFISLEVYFTNDITSTSQIQKTIIIDPFSSQFSYFLNSSLNFYNLYLFINEPDLSSGLKDVTCKYSGISYNVTRATSTYHLLVISINRFSNNIIVNITDFAGNQKIGKILIPPNNYSSNIIPDLEIYSILPSISTIIIIIGILVVKMVKKEKPVIL
jgi:hypothetical protein